MANNSNDLLNQYSFELPEYLVAKHARQISEHRLFSVNDQRHYNIDHFANLIEKDDLIVYNDSIVEKRRVMVERASGGSKQLLLLQSPDRINWQALINKQYSLQNGEVLYAKKNRDIEFLIIEKGEIAHIVSNKELDSDLLDSIGEMPIPFYFNRDANDEDNIYYQNPLHTETSPQSGGSAAAPTSILHFNAGLIDIVEKKKAQIKPLTLDISYGTFAKISEENFIQNKLHEENYQISKELAKTLAKNKYNRLICIGTTALRALETVWLKTKGKYNHSLAGVSDLFLYPPYQVQSIDALLTNFHLPGSTLMLLVGCLVNKELLLKSYRAAISEKLKFYSYGDAMIYFKEKI